MANPTIQPSPFSLLSCLGGTDGSNCFSQANEPGLKLYGNDDIGVKAVGQEEEFLTPEFSNLSIQEQSKALHDLHRAGSELQEDPAMIDRLLTDFEHEIERGSHPIYDQALRQDRSYVEDPAFRLKFLRATMHDVKKSVKQMVSFLQHKSTYFGTDKVASDITIDDFSAEELKLMLSGIYHIQEDTDRNGRVILHWFNKSVPYVTSKTIIRINYYIWFNILIPIHSVQKKGLLVIFYDVRKKEDTQVDSGKPSMMQIFNFMSCVPIRYSGLHFCLKLREGNLAWNRLFLDIAVKAAPKYARERACVHYGSDVELRYKLANYGIPLDTFPVDVNGNIRESILNTWLHNHLAKEGSLKSHGSTIQGISFPGEDYTSSSSGDGEDAPSSSVQDAIWQTDVLLGRGRLVQYHPGNIRFRELLEEHSAEYESLLRNQRRQACIDLTNELVGNGTRFLKHGENGEWYVCCFEDAVDKVSQFYRTRRRRTREHGHV